MGKYETEEEKAYKKEYAKKYYQEHKEEILKKKRERYKTDPEYRKSIVDAKIKNYKRYKEEKKAYKKLLKKNPLLKEPREVLIEVAGKKFIVPVRTLGYLATVLGTTVRMIRHWEREGIIPEPKYRDGRGVRLYPDFQVKKIAEIWWGIRSQQPNPSRVQMQKTDMRARLHQLWADYPLGFEPSEEREFIEDEEDDS